MIFYSVRFRISTQCYTIIWLLEYFSGIKKSSRAIGTQTNEKGELVFSTLTHHNKFSISTFSIQLLFQRVDLPGARTGGLPPIGGSPTRGARIFLKKKKKRKKKKKSARKKERKQIGPLSSDHVVNQTPF